MKIKFLKASLYTLGAYFFLHTNVAIGQSVAENHEDYFKKALYKTNAPNSWGFSDFSKEGSVDVSTGRFGLTIPFTSIENSYISLPIQLSYSTGGVKLSENASEVGMGWNLIAGGSVTRILKGVPDEVVAPPKAISSIDDEGGTFSGMNNLFTGQIAPAYYNNPNGGGFHFQQTNSLVTKFYRGSATKGYQDYYSNNYPTPFNAPYVSIAPADYLQSSIIQIQSMPYNIENTRDVFHVSVGDLNFNFILKLKDQFTSSDVFGFVTNGIIMFDAVPLDDKDIQIEIQFGTIDNYWYTWTSDTQRQKVEGEQAIKGFVITDKKGVKYYFQDYAFSEPEYVRTLQNHSSAGTNYERTVQYVLQDVYINNWELTKITLPNGKNINYNYTKQRTSEEKLVPRQHDGEYTGHPYNLRPQKPPYAIEKVNFGREKLYLNTIQAEDLTVKFNYDNSPRTDLQNGKRLSSMQLFDPNNLLIKEFDLLQQYFGASTANNFESTRLFLTDVVEKNIATRLPITYKTSEDIKYSFDYYNPNSLPGKNAVGFEDLYGYYLGNTIENAYPPFPKLYVTAAIEGHRVSYYPVDTDTFTFNGAERRPNPTTVNYGTLKTISFPTKGSLEIIYEPNKFYEGYFIDPNPNGPGCRVSQLKYYSDSNRLEKIKRYNYSNFDNPAFSSGVIMYSPSFAYISNWAIDNAQDLGVEQTHTYTNLEININIYYKYTKTAEQLRSEGITDVPTIIKKMITTSTHALGPQSDIFGREIIYTNTSEEDISIVDNLAKGKTKYYNYYTDNRPEVNVLSGPTDEFTYIPPASKNVFKDQNQTIVPWYSDRNGGYLKVRYGYVEKKGKDIYPFPERNYFSNDDALKIGKTYKIEYLNGNDRVRENDYSFTRLSNSSYKNLNFQFGYLPTYYYGTSILPERRSTDITRQNNGGLYYYAIDNMFTNQKLVLQNEGTIDYTPSGDIHTTKQYEYNDKFLTSKTSYQNSDGDLAEDRFYYPFNLYDDDQPSWTVLSQMVGINMISDPLKQESYLNGQMTESKLKTYKLTTLITLDKIFNKKGSISSVGAIDENDLYASFDSNDQRGNILQYTLRNGTPVSVIWGYNYAYPIAKIENCLFSSIPDDTVNLLKNLSANDNDSCFTGTCHEQTLRNALNTLRTLFPNSMVTTYTYDPLIGLTSSTDAKGKRIIYEYDGFGRLKDVRDDENNILSENQYHYKQ